MGGLYGHVSLYKNTVSTIQVSHGHEKTMESYGKKFSQSWKVMELDRECGTSVAMAASLNRRWGLVSIQRLDATTRTKVVLTWSWNVMEFGPQISVGTQDISLYIISKLLKVTTELLTFNRLLITYWLNLSDSSSLDDEASLGISAFIMSNRNILGLFVAYLYEYLLKYNPMGLNYQEHFILIMFFFYYIVYEYLCLDINEPLDLTWHVLSDKGHLYKTVKPDDMTAGCVHESYVTLIHFNILCDTQVEVLCQGGKRKVFMKHLPLPWYR